MLVVECGSTGYARLCLNALILPVPKICICRALVHRLLHGRLEMNAPWVWVRICIVLHNLQILFQSLGTEDNRTMVRISFTNNHVKGSNVKCRYTGSMDIQELARESSE